MNLRDQLQQIYDQHQKLHPALVVNEARDENHPLHDRFEWDDSIAGEAWRRQQAHELIKSVRITYRKADESENSVRAFHAVRSEQGYTYEPTEKVVADPFTAKLVLADMEREWKALFRRYNEFDEFYAMVRADLDVA